MLINVLTYLYTVIQGMLELEEIKMKKRYVLIAGLLAMSLVTGCGDKKSSGADASVTPTPEATIETSGKGNVVEMQQSTGIDKSKITNIMGTKTASSSELVITNNTGLEIASFYTRPAGEEDWSDDYIQSKFRLADKGQALFYYDSTAKDEDGNTITKYDLRISYTDEDEEDCLFRNLTLTDIEELKLNMEDGVPFVKYASLSTKKEISTLEDAKARMGRTDSDDDDSSVTPTPTETPSGSDSGTTTPAETPTETDAPQPTTEPGDSSDPGNQAQDYIGSNVDNLYNDLGAPGSSNYETDPESGAETGYLYYDGFTVSTNVDPDGNETVTGVW